MPFTQIENAVAAIERGELVIVVDDADRENEGDLIMAAEKVTAESIAFMIRHTSGVICQPLEGDRCDSLSLPLMVAHNTETQRTAFTVSVDARAGTTTGISAADRAATVHALIDPQTRPDDLARPGHIFPLRYREGGVLKRAGHTEAAVDLARLAGLYPSGVLAEVTNDDGTMARLPQLERFAAEHGLQLISIADLIRYRRHREKLVRRVSEARIPTRHGDFTAYVFESLLDGVEHLAFVRGEIAGTEDVLVRVHSECLTGDVFGSMRCDCGVQLDSALERVSQEDRGVVVYLRGHEGRGIGLGPQAARVHPAGRRPRHRRGERRARLPRRLARVRDRVADPRRSRGHDHAAHDQQSLQVRRSRGVRSRDRRTRPAPRRSEPREHLVPAREAGEARSPPGPG